MLFFFEMAIWNDIEKVVLPVLERYGCDLVLGTFQTEQSGWVLRLLIERKGADPDAGAGVDLKLCSSVSRDLSAELDVEETIDRPYTLEVSSPGVERPLVRREDYERFSGREIKLKTVRAVEGRRTFRGLLGGVSNGAVRLSGADGGTIEVPLKLVEKANLVFEPKGFRSKLGE